jgi:hypothetical protein
VSQERFDIYFAGELLPDHAPEAVRQWLGAQFKLQGAALERLFSGQPVRIKQGVDPDTAGRYRAAFRKAGALLDIRPAAAEATAPAAPPAAHAPAEQQGVATDPRDAGGTGPQLLPANTGSLEDCAEPVAAVVLPDIGHLTLDASGATLDERRPPPPADIDTEHLSAGPPNSGDLSDCVTEQPARPIPDISQLQLADD